MRVVVLLCTVKRNRYLSSRLQHGWSPRMSCFGHPSFVPVPRETANNAAGLHRRPQPSLSDECTPVNALRLETFERSQLQQQR